jgi:hypothetical protein
VETVYAESKVYNRIIHLHIKSWKIVKLKMLLTLKLMLRFRTMWLSNYIDTEDPFLRMRLTSSPPFMESECIQDSATVSCPAQDKLCLMSYIFRFLFSNSSHLRIGLTNGLFRLPEYSFTSTFMSRLPRPLWLDQSNYFSWKARTANSHHVISPSILLLCSPQHPVLRYSQMCFSFTESSMWIKATDNI